MINKFKDIIKLTQELRKKMIYRETRRISLTNQAKNLFFFDDKIMRNSIEKFNKKWIEIENSNATDDDEELHCDMTNIYSNDAFDLYAKVSEIDFMFAKRAKMKMKMNV
jgi:predicted site-specific integrase-resolvase